MTTRLTGGRVILSDASVVRADVEFDARITAVAAPGTLPAVPQPDSVIDVSGRYVAPGFVDIQINGGWGHDFTADPCSIGRVAAELPATGVSSFVPTIVTSPPDRRVAAIEALAATSLGPTDAVPLGLHFEGPAIAADRRGAHDPAHIGRPSTDDVARWTADDGVRMVTLAPELDGAVELTQRLVATGVVVAIGHTACTPGQFAAVRQAGATVVTHLFNAMAPFDHRRPGPVGATLADPSVFAGLICDGIHVDPTAVAVAWRTLGPSRFVLVTDAMAALGMSDAGAKLATLDVVVGADGVRTADGTLAGSNLRLDVAVRNLVAMTGCDVAEAVCAASTTPASALGLADRGRVEVGARADLVVLDPELHVERTIVNGATAWKS